MIFQLIVTFMLLLLIIIISMQNSMPLDLTFFVWKLHMSLTALIFYASAFGGAIVAILTLPKLVNKYINVRNLNKERYELKKKALEQEKQGVARIKAK